MPRRCRFLRPPSPRSVANRQNARAAAAIVAALALGPQASWAEDQPSAIGRLSTQKGDSLGGFCTGVLVAPDLVMTAGHCLPSPFKSGMQTYRFDPGYGHGPTATGYVGQVFINMPFRPEGPLKLENDIAFLKLDQPVPEEVATPLQILGDKVPKTTVFWGYDGRRPERGPVPRTCRLQAEFPMGVPTIVGLSCKAVGGNSGAPLLVRVGTQWQVAAVLVARTEGKMGSLAVIPPPDLPEILLPSDK